MKKKLTLACLAMAYLSALSYVQAQSLQGARFHTAVYEGTQTLTLLDGPLNDHLVLATPADSAKVRFSVMNGVLYVEEMAEISGRANIIVSIRGIDSVWVGGYARLASNVPIQERFALYCEGNASTYLHAELPAGQQLRVYNASEGDVSVHGHTDALYIWNGGKGHVEARTLHAQDVQVDLMGKGDVFIQPHGKLYANVEGAGYVYYVSKPVDAQTKNGVGGGDMVRLY